MTVGWEEEITSSAQILGKHILACRNAPSLVLEGGKRAAHPLGPGAGFKNSSLPPPGSRKPLIRIDTRESRSPTSHFSSVPTEDKDLFVSVCMLEKMNGDLITAAHFLKGSPIYDGPYVLPAALPPRAGVLSDFLR